MAEHLWSMFNLNFIIMKKWLQISAHLALWVFFVLNVQIVSTIYLEVKPDAPFSMHLTYVVFLELVMGLIFFYTTFLTLPWARKSTTNSFILGVILLLLVVIFAIPAMKIGIWQVMSSIVPHLFLIFLALVFRCHTVQEEIRA
jgi:hypothetical protein